MFESRTATKHPIPHCSFHFPAIYKDKQEDQFSIKFGISILTQNRFCQVCSSVFNVSFNQRAFAQILVRNENSPSCC